MDHIEETLRNIPELNLNRCWCWTTEENRIRVIVRHEPVIHKADCHNIRDCKEPLGRYGCANHVECP